jgi:hypothetical protein
MCLHWNLTSFVSWRCCFSFAFVLVSLGRGLYNYFTKIDHRSQLFLSLVWKFCMQIAILYFRISKDLDLHSGLPNTFFLVSVWSILGGVRGIVGIQFYIVAAYIFVHSLISKEICMVDWVPIVCTFYNNVNLFWRWIIEYLGGRCGDVIWCEPKAEI